MTLLQGVGYLCQISLAQNRNVFQTLTNYTISNFHSVLTPQHTKGTQTGN